MNLIKSAVLMVELFSFYAILKQPVEGSLSTHSGPLLSHASSNPSSLRKDKPTSNPSDGEKPYLRLWKRKLNDGVNYEYSYHNPVKDGTIDQQGSVTVFKSKEPNGDQPKSTGYVISYRTSQDFSYTNPLNSDWGLSNNPFYANNNMKNDDDGFSSNNNGYPGLYDNKYNQRYPPASRTYTGPSPYDRHLQQTSPPHATKPRCYGYHSNIVYCCMYADKTQASSSSYPKHICWRQRIKWSHSA